MTEHIRCRHCESPDCRGCNIYTLAAALERGKFDSLMDGNHAIHIETDIRENVRGKWIEDDDAIISGHCSVCGWNAILYETDVIGMPYCPNCGCIME